MQKDIVLGEFIITAEDILEKKAHSISFKRRVA
jgi:hypothetical protein